MKVALVALLIAAVLACEKRSASEPGSVRALDTPWGEVTVVGSASDEAVLAELAAGAARAAASGRGYTLDVRRLTIDARPLSQICDYSPSHLAPSTRVHRTLDCLDHEVIHHMACTVLGRQRDCCRCVDHGVDPGCPGGGYDLDCSPRGAG